MIRSRLTSLCLVLLSVFALAACSDGNNNNNRQNTLPNIIETAIAAGDFETLVAALQATGLDVTLSDEDQTFTVFAPTDDAFAALGEDTINTLLANLDVLSDILLYHVIAGQAVDAETAISLAGSLVEMANGDSVALTLRDGNLFINNSQVISVDIETSNGIIHVIDVVLTPPSDEEPTGTIVDVALASDDFNTLVAALQATGLDATLADESGTFTVFAPTDAAFALLGEDTINALLGDTDTLSDILLYHVVAGSAVDSLTALTLAGGDVEMANGDLAPIALTENGLTIGGAWIVMTDIPATNGVIHVIDAVLTPPSDDAAAGTIVDVALASEDFTTLVAALQATGLDATLADESGTFTVFAPTDAAFAMLGEDTINALLGDTDTLSDILLYHVITGSAVDAATALSLAGTNVTMANGDLAPIVQTEDGLTIAGAWIVMTDIAATNGIIHVLDMVILPPDE